jgi:hypothetical protein
MTILPWPSRTISTKLSGTAIGQLVDPFAAAEADGKDHRIRRAGANRRQENALTPRVQESARDRRARNGTNEVVEETGATLAEGMRVRMVRKTTLCGRDRGSVVRSDLPPN